MRNDSLLVAVAAVAIYAMAIHADGARSPIDFKNPAFQSLGEWAVAEHDRQAHDSIKFNKVVGGESDQSLQLGSILYLLIDATNRDGKNAKYEAMLNQKDPLDNVTLLSFKPAN